MVGDLVVKGLVLESGVLIASLTNDSYFSALLFSLG